MWVIHPHDRTLTRYRPDAEPELFNRTHELAGDPDLPGLRLRIADLFLT